MPTPPPRLSLWWLRSAARILAPPVFFLEGRHSSCWGPYVRAKIQKVTMVRPSRQPSVKGERLVLFEVNAVMGMAKATGLRALLGLSPWWLHWMDHVRKIGAGCFLWVQIVYLWLRIRNQKKTQFSTTAKTPGCFLWLFLQPGNSPSGCTTTINTICHNHKKHPLACRFVVRFGSVFALICGPLWVYIYIYIYIVSDVLNRQIMT